MGIGASRSFSSLLLALAGLALAGAAVPSSDHTPTVEETKEITRRALEKARHGDEEVTVDKLRADLAQRMPRPPTDPAAYATAVEKLRSQRSEELFAFAAYRGQLPVENLGQNAQMGTAAMRMASMNLPDSPTRLLAIYRQSLVDRPAFRTGKLGAQAGYVSFRGEDGFLRTLTFVAMGEATMVIAAVTDPERAAPAAMSVPTSFPGDLPMPAFAANPVDLRSEQDGFVQHTRQATTAERSPDALVTFFLERMAQAGWRHDSVRQETSLPIRTMTFSKDERMCSMTIVPNKEKTGCLLTALCLERRSNP